MITERRAGIGTAVRIVLPIKVRVELKRTHQRQGITLNRRGPRRARKSRTDHTVRGMTECGLTRTYVEHYIVQTAYHARSGSAMQPWSRSVIKVRPRVIHCSRDVEQITGMHGRTGKVVPDGLQQHLVPASRHRYLGPRGHPRDIVRGHRDRLARHGECRHSCGAIGKCTAGIGRPVTKKVAFGRRCGAKRDHIAFFISAVARTLNHRETLTHPVSFNGDEPVRGNRFPS